MRHNGYLELNMIYDKTFIDKFIFVNHYSFYFNKKKNTTGSSAAFIPNTFVNEF